MNPSPVFPRLFPSWASLMAFKDSAKVDKFLRGDGTVDGSPVEGTVVEIPLFTRFEHHPNGGLALGFLNHQQYVKRHVLRIWMSKVRSKSNDQFILGDCNLNEDRPNKLTFNGSSCPFELRIPKCLELFVFFSKLLGTSPQAVLFFRVPLSGCRQKCCTLLCLAGFPEIRRGDGINRTGYKHMLGKNTHDVAI